MRGVVPTPIGSELGLLGRNDTRLPGRQVVEVGDEGEHRSRRRADGHLASTRRIAPTLADPQRGEGRRTHATWYRGTLRGTSPPAERAAAAAASDPGRDNVLRRLSPAMLTRAVALAACSGRGPALTDPKEIISQEHAATSERPASISTWCQRNADHPANRRHFHPRRHNRRRRFRHRQQRTRTDLLDAGVISLSGEAIQIGTDSYLKTSLSGAKYIKSTAERTAVQRSIPTKRSPGGELPGQGGGGCEKLNHVNAAATSCYAVRLTIPTSPLAGGAGDAGPRRSQRLPWRGAVLDLQFDPESRTRPGHRRTLRRAGSARSGC